jgi:hypothetical protein
MECSDLGHIKIKTFFQYFDLTENLRIKQLFLIINFNNFNLTSYDAISKKCNLTS